MDFPDCSVGEGRSDKVIYLSPTASNGWATQHRLKVHHCSTALTTQGESEYKTESKGETGKKKGVMKRSAVHVSNTTS